MSLIKYFCVSRVQSALDDALALSAWRGSELQASTRFDAAGRAEGHILEFQSVSKASAKFAFHYLLRRFAIDRPTKSGPQTSPISRPKVTSFTTLQSSAVIAVRCSRVKCRTRLMRATVCISGPGDRYACHKSSSPPMASSLRWPSLNNHSLLESGCFQGWPRPRVGHRLREADLAHSQMRRDLP